jgi:DNA-binding transcriptional LysR family regulator
MATPDLNHVSVFVAVGRHGSFTAAAKVLGVPKSTVSRAIASLEAEMGVRLLHRTTRQVSLSTTGAALYERAAPALSSLQSALGELPELEDEPSGTLRITANVDFGTTVLADLVTRFTTRYPAVRVDVWLTNTVIDLVAEGIDVAFRIWRAPRLADSSLLAQKASPMAFQLFAAPTYLVRRGTPRSPDDLEAHDWVGFRDIPPRLSGPGGAVTLRWAPRFACDDMFFARELLRTGAGIGLLPTFLAEPDVAAGLVVRVLPRWDMPVGTMWVVSPSARHLSRKVKAFRAMALETLRARPLAGRSQAAGLR